MMRNPLAILAVGLWLGPGCAVETVQFLPDLWSWSSTDSGVPFPQGELSFDYGRVTWGCDSTRSDWTLRAFTLGPAGGGTMWLGQDGRPLESHELELVEASPDGSWDLYTVGPLLDGVSDVDFEPNLTTRFDCDEAEPSVIIVLRDRFGEAADCLRIGAFSADTNAIALSPEIAALGGCSF